METLTIDADVDAGPQGMGGGDGPVVDVTLVLDAVVLLPGDDLEDADRLRVPVLGPGEVGDEGDVAVAAGPGDVRGGGAAAGGAAQQEGLALHRLHAGLGDGGGARGQQNSEADGGRVELHPGPVLLDSTLELAIVSLVVCVRDVEIIATLGWAGLHPAVITVRTKSSERGGNIGQSEQRHANLPALLG